MADWTLSVRKASSNTGIEQIPLAAIALFVDDADAVTGATSIGLNTYLTGLATARCRTDLEVVTLTPRLISATARSVTGIDALTLTPTWITSPVDMVVVAGIDGVVLIPGMSLVLASAAAASGIDGDLAIIPNIELTVNDEGSVTGVDGFSVTAHAPDVSAYLNPYIVFSAAKPSMTFVGDAAPEEE